MAEADVADEGSVIGNRVETKERGKKIVCQVVSGGSERTIPVFPRRVGVVDREMIQDVGSEEMGDLLKDAL